MKMGVETAEALLEDQEALEVAEGMVDAEDRFIPYVPFIPTDEHRKIVKDMATAGLTMSMISLMVRWPHNDRPVSCKTLMRHFEHELYEGTMGANVAVGGALFKNAMAGNVSAQIFWAKTRMGWRETAQRVELTGKDGEKLDSMPAHGVLMVPAMASIDDWERVVSEQQAKLVKDGASFLSAAEMPVEP